MERKKRFLIILEGTTPADAEPVVATNDQRLIRDAFHVIQRRLAKPEKLTGKDGHADA
jgi:hypothetical protein